MKKLSLFIFAIFFSLLLTACGGTNHAGDTNTPGETSEQNDGGNEKDSSQEGNNETNTEPKLEIVMSAGRAWKNSIGTVWVHSAAVFENKGDVPVEIGETQMNFKAQDDSILGTASMIYPVPRIVGPGERAYISESTILDGVTDHNDYKETTFNFSFDVTEENANLLEVSGIKGIPGTDHSASPYKVTGVVKNTTDELQDDIRISAALFGEDGTLLAVLDGGVDVGVNPGSEAGFELNYPPLPEDIANKVETVEVKAYGWTW